MMHMTLYVCYGVLCCDICCVCVILRKELQTFLIDELSANLSKDSSSLCVCVCGWVGGWVWVWVGVWVWVCGCVGDTRLTAMF